MGTFICIIIHNSDALCAKYTLMWFILMRNPIIWRLTWRCAWHDNRMHLHYSLLGKIFIETILHHFDRWNFTITVTQQQLLLGIATPRKCCAAKAIKAPSKLSHNLALIPRSTSVVRHVSHVRQVTPLPSASLAA